MYSHDLGAKGEKGHSGDLEKLLPEGYSDNGYAEQAADDGIDKCKLDTGDQDPEDIQEQRKRSAFIHYLFAKRIQRNGG